MTAILFGLRPIGVRPLPQIGLDPKDFQKNIQRAIERYKNITKLFNLNASNLNSTKLPATKIDFGAKRFKFKVHRETIELKQTKCLELAKYRPSCAVLPEEPVENRLLVSLGFHRFHLLLFRLVHSMIIGSRN